MPPQEDDVWLIENETSENKPRSSRTTQRQETPVDLLTEVTPEPSNALPSGATNFPAHNTGSLNDPFLSHEFDSDSDIAIEDTRREYIEPSNEDAHELDTLDPTTGRASAANEGSGRWSTSQYNSRRSSVLGNVKPRVKRTEKSRDFDIRKLWNHYILRKKGVYGSGGNRTGPNGETVHEIREVYINDASHGKTFKSNYVSTTKYNVATFLPKFLFEQFSKYANLFFLATALIQQVPHVSPTNRFTTIGTLIVVLLVSGIKELAEDWKRWLADKELNTSIALVLDSNSGIWERKLWSKVRVGDIVHVEKGQPLPADMLVVSTSEPKGLCYIETSNLDGETNLKIKQARPETSGLTTESSLLSLTHSKIHSERPNSSLYTYEGVLKLNSGSSVPLGVDQMLLRGTSLRNTAWINGVVVFTGHETKLMRNATATPIKRTAVEYLMDWQIIFLFIILITMSIMSSLGNVIKVNQWRNSMWYLMLQETSSVKVMFSDLLTYWILFSNLVPISLFVTIDIIKFWQGYLISSDLEMYDKTNDQPAVCRTSSLVEELGQIKHIFSDKTGTLTRNVMEFKACCINGTIYAAEIPEEKRGEYIPFGDNFAEVSPQAYEFLVLLSTCHTVIPEFHPGVSDKIEYQASSPDEGALVEGAAKLGVPFVSRTPSGLTINTPHLGERSYELLQVCEFNSTRKRMSTLLRCPDNKIRLFTKGADTVIFERLAHPSQETEVSGALEEFAGMGLRTLCLASRVVPEKEYEEWAKRYQAAATSMENRSEKLAAAANEIEQQLELIGVTAIEDKLQEGVPETIASLQDAGIKIWVLTGDRQETAINVGMSSKLLSEDMSLLLINETGLDNVRSNLEAKLEVMRSIGDETGLKESDTVALVIDGHSLTFALEPECSQLFLELAVMCKAIICCRVSPLQKAMVVKLVKHNTTDLLLAIGDGANDVSMIQAAHVGVGISGLEGQQAARSADIAISQFRYLKRLLLVHGLWSYNRLSRAILYSFYKNIALYFTQFYYVFYNGFSGESVYESWTVTFYNVFSTALPPMAMGILDQFVSAKLLLRYPQLYRMGQRGVFLNTRQFWEWILNGIYHSIIIFWFSVGAYSIGNTLTNGLVANHWSWGGAMYTSCVFTVLGKAALVTNVWNTWTMFAIPGSAALWLIGYPLYAEIGPRVGVGRENRGVIPALYPMAVFWALIFLTPMFCLLRDIAWKYWRRMYTPEYYHYVQEIQKFKINDRRPQMDQFQKAIRKVRQVARMRKQRGFAFSASDEGAERVVRAYDTSK